MKTKMFHKTISGVSTLALCALLTAGFQAKADDNKVTLEVTPQPLQVAAGDEFELTIKLKNPQQHSVVSARTWLEYDPQVVEGVAVTRGEDMDLTAPGEDKFVPAEKLIALGFAKSGGITKTEIEVAKIKLRAKTGFVGTEINFHKFGEYTVAKSVSVRTTTNILQNPASSNSTHKIVIGSRSSGGGGGGSGGSSSKNHGGGGGAYRDDLFTEVAVNHNSETENQPPRVGGGGEVTENPDDTSPSSETQNSDSTGTGRDFRLEKEQMNSGLWKISAHLNQKIADQKFKFAASEGVLDQNQVQTDSQGRAYVLYSTPARNGNFAVTALLVGHSSQQVHILVTDQADAEQAKKTDELEVHAASDTHQRPPELVKTGAGEIGVLLMPLVLAGYAVLRRRRHQTIKF